MPRVAYFCTDLLFTSKIRETARSLGWVAELVREPAALATTARGADAVVIDLRLPQALAALEALRSAGGASSPRTVIGFCDHERVDLFAAARAGGCTHVLSKGKFSTDLQRLLPVAVAEVL